MFAAFLLTFAVAYTNAQATDLIVNTTEGTVQGRIASDGNYYAFYGIHYGGNTDGENRFKPPTPAPQFSGTYNAIDSGVLCAQPSARGLIGTENCLVLDIFTNATNPPKPVVVWLVGTEYTKTGNRQSFQKLVKEGVVIVQLNYRLSIFGFLCLGVPEASGNAGLKDVMQGLKWIKQNIIGFGGNPDNVILFGHESGAAMVDLITLSTESKGLVHKAITQSGSALAPWAISYTPVEYARAVGEKLKYTKKTNSELAKKLVSADINLIANALTEFEFYNNTILFAPCIENSQLNDTFLTDTPINILRSGNYNHIPYIAGYTDNEGTIRAQEAVYNHWLEKMQENFTLFLPVDLEFGTNLTDVAKTIRDFYFTERPINMETVDDFLDYQGDINILVSVIRGVTERAATTTSEVRLMEFAYRGTLNSDWAYPTITLTGAKHGSVLNFLLDFDLRPEDANVSNLLIRRFVTFFNSGSPNTGSETTWVPISKGSLQYLLYSGSNGPQPRTGIFSEEPKVNPHEQRMTLWNNIYSKYYVPPKTVSSAVKVLGMAVLLTLMQMMLIFL